MAAWENNPSTIAARERERFIAAIVWLLRQVPATPPATGTSGWVPSDLVLWEQDLEVVERTLRAARGDDAKNEVLSPAELEFEQAALVEVPVTERLSVPMGDPNGGPLHFRVRRKEPPAPEECSKWCRRCALEAQKG